MNKNVTFAIHISSNSTMLMKKVKGQLGRLSMVLLCVLQLFFVNAQNQRCVVKGWVMDETRAPLQYATVTVDDGNAVVASSLTNAEGEYAVEIDRAEKNYRLSVSFLGKSAQQKSFAANAKRVVMDTIVMDFKYNQLDVVKISGQPSEQKTSEVTNVAPQSAMTEMKGSVLDILRTVPSISVDNEGNVLIRGNSNVQIILDGVSVSMTNLDAIPSANVANVEVITSPDATYDAEGTGGIINIVTKKGQARGWSGMASVNYGFNHFTNANLAFSYANGGHAFRFNYNVKYEDDIIAGGLYRRFVENGNWLDQQFQTARTVLNNNIGLGATFRIRKKHVLNVDLRFIMPRLNTKQQFANNYGVGELLNNENRQGDVSWNRENIDGVVSYLHVINPQSNITLRASVSKIWGHRPSFYFLERDSIAKSNSGGSPLNTFAQCDYRRIEKYGTWETGVKFTYRQNSIFHEFYDYINADWVYSEAYSNDLLHREFIPAAYVMFSSNPAKPLKWKAGVRLEYGGVKLHNEKNVLDTLTHHVFVGPSLSMNYGIKSKSEMLMQDVSVAFSSRIGRPTYPQLNPYMSMIDAHTFEQGNMCLRPETSYHLEFSYFLKYKVVSFTPNLYATYILDNITQVASLLDDILLLTYVNGSYDFKTGLDLALGVKPCKWFEAVFSSNTFYVNTKGDFEGVDLDNKGWCNSSNLKMVFHPVKSMDIQAQYFVETPQYYPQFTTSLAHHLDLGISQKFLKGSLVVSLLLTDVFKTNNWDVHSNNRIYHLTNTSFHKSRMLWIGVRYNFNAYKGGGQQKKDEEDKSRVRLGL